MHPEGAPACKIFQSANKYIMHGSSTRARGYSSVPEKTGRPIPLEKTCVSHVPSLERVEGIPALSFTPNKKQKQTFLIRTLRSSSSKLWLHPLSS